ncbi:MAG: hypothetical protein ACOCX1_04580, partial [Fimbriimonadaceae bacterium]
KAERLLEDYGRLFSDEVGIKLKDQPAPLYQWLTAAQLMSARIGAENAIEGTKALFDNGLTTPEKMADATWKDRVDILNNNGYARYDESTSRMLGENAEVLIGKYAGDLRKLREEAEKDPKKEHELVQQFKGIGELGANIFCREAQLVWDELHPFSDERALETAEEIGLPKDAKRLADQVSQTDYPRLLAALMRMRLEGSQDQYK